jgi:crotonobetainyl-CoA:carnitine CoA-transferase CaiB-like acyl-CoA transferase
MPDAGLHGLHALYRLYETREGWVFVAAPGDRDFARLCHALDRARLVEDPRYSTQAARADHDAELGRELAEVFAQRGADAWERDLATTGIACVRAHDGSHAAYVFDGPLGEKLGLAEESAATGLGPYRRYARVVRTAHDLGPVGVAEQAGAQTRGILAELGYDTREVESLLASGVVAAPD